MLSKEQKKKYLRVYRRRENLNYHTENAIMLIKLFGTKSEYIKATKIKRVIDKRMTGVTKAESDWFYKHGHSHFNKLLN